MKKMENLETESRIHNQWYKEQNGYWNESKGIYGKHKSNELLKDSIIKIFDFKYYNIESIKRDFNYKYWEKISLFITVLYNEHFNGNKCTDWEYIYMEAKTIRTYLGRDYIPILEKLSDLGIIELNLKVSKHNKSKKCKFLKLNKAFIKVDGEVYSIRNLISEKYQNSILELYYSYLINRKGILKHIEKVIDKCTFNLGENRNSLDMEIANDKFVKEKKRLSNVFESDLEKKQLLIKLNNKDAFLKELITHLNKYYDGLLCKLDRHEILRRYDYNIRVQNFGNRISHILSNMPKKYRKWLKMDKEDVVEVDIVSSQVAFLNLLLKKWYESDSAVSMKSSIPFIMMDKLEMLYSENSKMDLYKYMALKLTGIQGVADSSIRNEMKLVFMGLLFGSTMHEKYKNRNRKEMVSELFGSEFYDLMLEIEKSDVDGINERKYRNLSALLQREESKFLSEVMNLLIKEEVMFLPLYDSLIVKKSDAIRVNKAFDSIIELNGFKGIVKVK